MRRLAKAGCAFLVVAGLIAGTVLVVLGASGAQQGAPPGPHSLSAAVAGSPGVAVASPGPAGPAGGPAACRTAASANPPLEVSIPRLDVQAPVTERVGVIPSGPERGLLTAPTDYHDLGWYTYCGDGVLLVDGHVGFATGAGPLAYIGQLSPGDAVAVRYHGHTSSYAVAKVVDLRKGALPASYFTARYSGDLMLITCDYQSTFQNGHFADNVYVLAVPTRR